MMRAKATSGIALIVMATVVTGIAMYPTEAELKIKCWMHPAKFRHGEDSWRRGF